MLLFARHDVQQKRFQVKWWLWMDDLEYLRIICTTWNLMAWTCEEDYFPLTPSGFAGSM